MKKLMAMIVLFGVQSAFGMDKNWDVDLLAACEKGDLAKVEVALAFGANPNAEKIKTKFTPLMEVAGSITTFEACYVPIVHALIEAKANVDAINPILGQTALMMAAAHNRPLVMKALIEDKANVNIQNENGFTALMEAALHMRPDAVQLLLEHKAEVNAQTVHGTTALGFPRDLSCNPTDYVTDIDIKRASVIDLLQRAGGQRVSFGTTYK